MLLAETSSALESTSKFKSRSIHAKKCLVWCEQGTYNGSMIACRMMMALKLKALVVGMGLVLCSPCSGQFSAKWDQFLPLDVTPFGNGNVTQLIEWKEKVYAYVGTKVFSSPDGESWSEEPEIPPAIQAPDKIVNGVAFNFTNSVLSHDLKTWKAIVTLDGKKVTIGDVAYLDGWWVAVNRYGQIFRSDDLLVWRSERTPTQ